MVRQFSQPLLAVSLSACAMVLALPRATAQCQTQWLPGPTQAGTDSPVRAAIWWDPDGAGPLQSVLAVGGGFHSAGPFAANGVAVVDPVSGTWSALGSGVGGPLGPGLFAGVVAMTAAPNGDLVVGGAFDTAGGLPASNIARWNGTSWSALGAGIGNYGVTALAALPNGDIVATGPFTSAGGVSVDGIARWDGSAWWPLGSGLGFPGMTGNCLVTLQNGDLVVGGSFDTAGGTTVNNIARWNGSTWSALGAGLTSLGGAAVQSLVRMPNGDLVASGLFTNSGTTSVASIARWDGASWSALGSGLSSGANALAVLPNGNVVAGGNFNQAGAAVANRIAVWDGATWSPLGSGIDGEVLALAVLPNSDLLAFGYFTTAGSVNANQVARWNGTSWAAIFPPSTATFAALNATTGNVKALVPLPNGDVIVGGWFTSAGGTIVNNVARWNGTTWSPLGTGTVGGLRAMALLPNGDVAAAGPVGGSSSTNFVVLWNGTSWSPLGSGMNNDVRTLATLADGTLVAGGAFWVAGGVAVNQVAAWNGASWAPLGSPGLGIVEAFTRASNGDLVAAGHGWPNADAARWNGSAWLPLGPPLFHHLLAVTELPNGDLVAGGFNSVAQWNGAAWSPLASSFVGVVSALCTLPDGDLLAGGSFTSIGGVSANNIARWDGSSWSPVGSGITGPGFHGVSALTTLSLGDVLAGGEFTVAGGVPSTNIARLTTTCPAATVSYGAACAGSGGTNVLAATTLPWLGATFRATATGMPASGFAAAVSGFTPIAIALPSILPQGVPGCTALVSPDFIEVVLPVAGVAQSQLVLPDAPSLAGIVVHHQVAPFELDASFVLTAVTSTNALTLTLGAF